jgi:hypothetical protein
VDRRPVHNLFRCYSLPWWGWRVGFWRGACILITLSLEGGEWSPSQYNYFIPTDRAPSTPCIGGWVDPRTGLELCPTYPACSQYCTAWATLAHVNCKMNFNSPWIRCIANTCSVENVFEKDSPIYQRHILTRVWMWLLKRNWTLLVVRFNSISMNACAVLCWWSWMRLKYAPYFNYASDSTTLRLVGPVVELCEVGTLWFDWIMLFILQWQRCRLPYWSETLSTVTEFFIQTNNW